jgi:lauroyl/myristoyl acyltransferase
MEGGGLSGRRLEAPHRRAASGSSGLRILERSAVVGYRAIEWVVAHVPSGIPRSIIARGAQVSYLLWPMKRGWSNENFGHVLGLEPGDRRVRATALTAYGEYARYVVEMMRLPILPPAEAANLIVGDELDRVEPIWREAKGGLILALCHIGNAEAAAAGVAKRGWPINVLADDSTFPEMFEHFRQTREQWGVHVIPWRNLREIYAVLRHREMLGLFVDWGYRPDGIPVKLFGAWTTLPAGPAALAAKTGSRIVPLAIRRRPDGRTFTVGVGDPIDVASSSPAAQLAATQQLATALEASIAAAPSQWYSFKPIWPSDPASAGDLERRATEMATQHGPVAREPAPA